MTAHARLANVAYMLGNLDGLAKTAEALSSPLTKLIEVGATGLGALGGPPLLLLKAHCEGKAALIRAGYEHDLRRLKDRQETELRALPGPEVAQLASGNLGPGEIEIIFEKDERADAARALHTVATRAMKRRANSMAILAEAADAIGDNVSDDPVDPDWTTRFFTNAQDVSTPQLQQLWGKLLAREVEDPGAVPLRTLEILRNITRSEATLLQRFKTYMLDEPACLYQPGVGLSNAELRILEESGVLEPVSVHLVWEDYMQPQPTSGASTKTLATGRSRARLRFPTGQTLEIVTFGQHLDFPIARVTPAAAPLVRMVYEYTDAGYVRELVLKLPIGIEPRVEIVVHEPKLAQPD